MKLKLIVFFIFCVGDFQITMAQMPPGLPGSGGGTNVDDVPIQFLIYPLILLGAYLGFRTIKDSK